MPRPHGRGPAARAPRLQRALRLRGRGAGGMRPRRAASPTRPGRHLSLRARPGPAAAAVARFAYSSATRRPKQPRLRRRLVACCLVAEASLCVRGGPLLAGLGRRLGTGQHHSGGGGRGRRRRPRPASCGRFSKPEPWWCSATGSGASSYAWCSSSCC